MTPALLLSNCLCTYESLYVCVYMYTCLLCNIELGQACGIYIVFAECNAQWNDIYYIPSISSLALPFCASF